jgi:hypothetical protein
MTIPVELGPARDVIAELRERVTAVERDQAEQRRRGGVRVLGRRRVLAQSWKESPSSVEPRRGRRPRFAGGVVERVAALLRYREFLGAYRKARTRWLAGLRTVFPFGTYWLARYAAIDVASSRPPALA